MTCRKSLMFPFLAVHFCIMCDSQAPGWQTGISNGPDIDPVPGPHAFFWKPKVDGGLGKGIPVTFPLFNAKKNEFLEFRTKSYYASSRLKESHDVDSQGNLRGHTHHRDNYPEKENIYNKDYVVMADAYWDIRYQVGVVLNMQRFDNANTTRNCYAYALNGFIQRGTYNYWIDEHNARDGVLGDVTLAFRADAEPVPKKDVAPHNVLLYQGNGNDHASGVYATTCDLPRVPAILAWKYGGSGYYSFVVDTSQPYDTPLYLWNSQPLDLQPLPTGTWSLGGSGSEANLNPTGKVWRAHPK